MILETQISKNDKCDDHDGVQSPGDESAADDWVQNPGKESEENYRDPTKDPKNKLTSADVFPLKLGKGQKKHQHGKG